MMECHPRNPSLTQQRKLVKHRQPVRIHVRAGAKKVCSCVAHSGWLSWVLIATTLIDWLEICPIIKGRVQLTNTDALKGKGRDWTCPLGVAPGSKLQQLMREDRASNLPSAKKQE
ncbi:g6484 [Coccomyxa viridis]|uniref:G6484 protein n=1 Tax=Coccomyxa viridis TaxID=1274662 RepID=A0ABP1FZF7_9CHLO